jgi:hypothetical protein
MTAKKYLLIGTAVAAIAGLTAVGEVLAQSSKHSSPPPVCSPAVCNSQIHATQPQVQCGTKNGCPVCVDILPSTPIDTGTSCKFQWNVYNLNTSSFSKAAIAYECTPGIFATGANGCGIGNNSSSYPANKFKGIFQLDSVNAAITVGNPSTIAYTINNSCADRGPNDAVLKYGDDAKTCTGPIQGFGQTNTFASTASCQIQQLGSSDCQIQTCFTYGAGNALLSAVITKVGGTCTINPTASTGLPFGQTDVPDGTIIKYGTNSCYQITYRRKTTWVATDPDTISTCPPSS